MKYAKHALFAGALLLSGVSKAENVNFYNYSYGLVIRL